MFVVFSADGSPGDYEHVQHDQRGEQLCLQQEGRPEFTRLQVGGATIFHFNTLYHGS